jgi:hypothetical protein
MLGGMGGQMGLRALLMGAGRKALPHLLKSAPRLAGLAAKQLPAKLGGGTLASGAAGLAGFGVGFPAGMVGTEALIGGHGDDNEVPPEQLPGPLPMNQDALTQRIGQEEQLRRMLDEMGIDIEDLIGTPAGGGLF